MLKQSSALAFAFMASRAFAATLPTSILHAIETHLTAAGATPVVVPAQTCTSARQSKAVAWSDFQRKYPNGVYVVCDWQVSRNTANVNILYFTFSAGWGMVELTSNTVAGFSPSSANAWQVTQWSETVHDYNPPPHNE